MINYLKGIYHYLLAWLGNVIFWFPSRRIFVLGVTGTKGKSTTLELINAILEAAGKKTAIVSSLRFKIADKSEKNTTSMTMPGRFFIQNFLRKAVNAGCDYFLMEVTSQGILQHRHRFIDFDAALMTNVRPEHIEAHGSFENYRQAKVSFFEWVAYGSCKKQKFFFINDEDSSKSHFINAVNGAGKNVYHHTKRELVSSAQSSDDSRYGVVVYFSREIFIENDLNNGMESIGDWLSSNFNLENAAAAVAFAKSQGIDWNLIKKTLQSFSGVPGRLEYVQKEPFAVVIDYAHTPDSLNKVYETLLSSKSDLICVLGAAGGGRDKWKRPEMGRIAAQNCKTIVLANEDPYDEDPSQILSDIKSGILKTKFPVAQIYEILDRRAAIKKAISLAYKGDVVVITGKGSEDWIHVVKGKKLPWSERSVAEEILSTKSR